MNCKQANQISIISYLTNQGYSPKKSNEIDVWFLSPFRNEKTSSFKVNLARNVWYDFAEGIGGRLIDLVMKLNQCELKHALQLLSNDSFSFQKQEVFFTIKKNKSYRILKVTELENERLISYLKSRKIDIERAKKYCYQIHYTFNNNTECFAIGFMNDSGGFEIRNKYFKGCLGKKNITSIINDSTTVSIFESWSDFLSYLTIKKHIPNEDFITLNSTSLITRVICKISNYKSIKLFFDSDESGNKARDIIQNKFPNSKDYSSKYNEYKDLNEYLIETTKT